MKSPRPKSLYLHNRHTSPQQAGKFQQYPTFSGGSTQSPPTQCLMGTREFPLDLCPDYWVVLPFSGFVYSAMDLKASGSVDSWDSVGWSLCGNRKSEVLFNISTPPEGCVTDAYQPENPAQPFQEAFLVPGRSRAFRYSQTIISFLLILIYSLAWKQRLIESKVLQQSSAGNLVALV